MSIYKFLSNSFLTLSVATMILSNGKALANGIVPPGQPISLDHLPGDRLQGIGNHLSYPDMFLGKTLIISGNPQKKTFELIDRSTGASIAELRSMENLVSSELRILKADISADEKLIAVIYNDKTVQIIEVEYDSVNANVIISAKVSKTIKLTSGNLSNTVNSSDIRLSPNGKNIVVRINQLYYLGSTLGKLKQIEALAFLGFSGDSKKFFYLPKSLKADVVSQDLATGKSTPLIFHVTYSSSGNIVFVSNQRDSTKPSTIGQGFASSKNGNYVIFNQNDKAVVLDIRKGKFLEKTLGSLDKYSKFFLTKDDQFLVIANKYDVKIIDTKSWSIRKSLGSSDYLNAFDVFDMSTKTKNQFLVTKTPNQQSPEAQSEIMKIEGPNLENQASVFFSGIEKGTISADGSTFVGLMPTDANLRKIIVLNTADLKINTAPAIIPAPIRLYLSPNGKDLIYTIPFTYQNNNGDPIADSRSQLLNIE